jgi:hypothetical protein
MVVRVGSDHDRVARGRDGTAEPVGLRWVACGELLLRAPGRAIANVDVGRARILEVRVVVVGGSDHDLVAPNGDGEAELGAVLGVGGDQLLLFTPGRPVPDEHIGSAGAAPLVGSSHDDRVARNGHGVAEFPVDLPAVGELGLFAPARPVPHEHVGDALGADPLGGSSHDDRVARNGHGVTEVAIAERLAGDELGFLGRGAQDRLLRQSRGWRGQQEGCQGQRDLTLRDHDHLRWQCVLTPNKGPKDTGTPVQRVRIPPFAVLGAMRVNAARLGWQGPPT